MFRLIRQARSIQVSKFFNIVPALLILIGVGFTSQARAQFTPRTVPAPTVQGTSLPDAGVPSIIVPGNGSQFYVLNQDLSLLAHSTISSAYNDSCPAPADFALTTAPHSLATDNQNVFITAQGATSGTTAVLALLPYTASAVNCRSTASVSFPGGIPAATLSAQDPRHSRLFVVNTSNSSIPDQIAMYDTSQVANGSGAGTISQTARTSLDTNAVYTSVVTDTTGDYGLTAITELKTATSPGNLWVYSPGINTAFKILGPGGVALPAVTSFIIHNPIDDTGNLLVLVNQDGLTSSNLFSPPQDATPFTIIDLGALQKTFATVVATGNTITLPFVTTIQATQPYYAMLGAAFNPVDNRIYAVVGGGTDTSNVFKDVISYDPYNPSAPTETVVADVTSVPLTFGSYPQIALNAASGTLQILTSNPSAVYTVGISGTGNTSAVVTGTPFSDSNFQPTYIAANPLLGETYIASKNSLVDIIGRPATSKTQASITLRGSGFSSSTSYFLNVLTLYPVVDSALIAAPLTITATPQGGGAATVLTTMTVGGSAYPGGSQTVTFPANGIYSVVATVPATANYPALTSVPLIVSIASGGAHATAITVSVPSASVSTTFNATVNLTGITYAPSGRVVINDATGTEVARKTLPAGAITLPIVIPVTLPVGSTYVTAVYNGDNDNAAATSAHANISVGSKPTPALALTIPSGTAGATLTGNIAFNTSSTTPPTGNIVITAVPTGSTTPITLATVSAATAFAGTSGTSFTFTAPAAGSYTATANYAGDTNYAAAPPSSPTFVISAGATQPPVAKSTVPATGTVGLSVAFSGAGSTDPKNETLTYSWAFGDGSTGTGVTTTHTYATAGTYTTVLTVTNTDTLTATATSAIVISAAAPVTTTLNISAAATVTAGSTFTTTVTLASATTPAAAVTGTVNITATPTGGGTATILASIPAAQAYVSGGKAISASIPSAGTYTLTATYAGDSSYAAATGSIGLTVAKAATLITLVGNSTGIVGTATNFTATLVGTLPGATGNVVITSLLGTTAGPGGTATFAQATAGYTLPLTFTTAGTYAVTATYAGDANNVATTKTVNIVVGAAASGVALTITAASTGTVGTLLPVSVLFSGVTAASFTNIDGVTITATPTSGTAAPITVTILATDAVIGTIANLAFSVPGTYSIQALYVVGAHVPTTTSPAIITVISDPSGLKPAFTMTMDDTTRATSNPLYVQHTTDSDQFSVTFKSFGGFNTPVNLASVFSPGITLPKDLVLSYIDPTTGKAVNSVTPTAAGVKLYFRLAGVNHVAAAYPPVDGFPRVPVYFAGGLIAVAFIGFRKRSLRASRAFRGLCGLLVLGTVCTTLGAFHGECAGNCNEDIFLDVNLVATPSTASQNAPVQTIPIQIEYDPKLSE